jgi:SAM-dependent methyltransferase
MKRKLKKVEGYISGDVLDIGCGNKPYKKIFKRAVTYTGTNSEEYYEDNVIYSTSTDDVIVNDGCNLPFEGDRFDSVLNFQVLPVFEDMDLFFREVGRVLKTGGCFLLTSDFLYPLWNNPHNYFRASVYGFRLLAERNDFEIIRIEAFGGYWTMAARVMHKYLVRQLANFIQRAKIERNPVRKLLKIIRLLIWIPLSILLPLIINPVYIVFHVFDRIALDEDFTCNYMMLARKK